jgi:hypothetical protein
VIILIPEDGIRLDGEQLNNMGSRDVQGIPYLMYSSDSLEAGSDLHIEISGRPSSGGPLLSLGSNSSLTVGLLAFGVALIVAGGWLFLRSRNGKKNQHEAQVDDHLPAPGGDEDVDTLLDTILALDDRYKAGEIPKEAYLKRREELKASIKELVREREA